ncbi:MAG: hypothetical protein ABH951_00615 [Patescibacteria group bacterium]
MKKIIKIVLLVVVIVWVGFEIVNYSEYISVKNKWNQSQAQYHIPMPGPKYQPVIVQKFYDAFPSLNPNKEMMVYKPVIYLYPTSTQKTKVQLDYQGELIADYPEYNIEEKGWTVIASPNGKLIGADGKEYSYLFWEGKPTNQINYDLSTGFIVRGEDTREFLQNTLSKIGLTPKEYNEFIVYWYPKMKDNKYNLIHFAGNEYTNTAPLIITPKPDSILRVFMVFKPLTKETSINIQEIKPFIREGFSVIEWGGTELE